MEGFGTNFRMLSLLRAAGVFRDHPFVLIDVGCSGGIDGAWRAFGETLIAHAFDVIPAECSRLQAKEKWPGVKYHPRRVGLPPDHEFVKQRKQAGPLLMHQHWERTSTAYALTLQSSGDGGKGGARADAIVDESAVLGVSEFIEEAGLDTVDFLKVDVDGNDLDVLTSAIDAFTSRQILGVGMEVNWVGSDQGGEHTFHNTDRFMRQHGFSLFGLSVRPYSRRDLPAPFRLPGIADTRFGQPMQGDAVYLRDLAAPHQRSLASGYSVAKLAKLASLFEMVQAPDCAAELINTFRDRFTSVMEPDLLLDALTPPLQGRRLSYREYLAAFERDVELFIPPISAQEENDRLKAEVEHLRAHLAELQASRSWQLASYLHGLAGKMGLRRTRGAKVAS